MGAARLPCKAASRRAGSAWGASGSKGAGCRLGLDRSDRSTRRRTTGDCMHAHVAACLPPRLPVAALRTCCAHPPSTHPVTRLYLCYPQRLFGQYCRSTPRPVPISQSEETRAKPASPCYVMSSRIRFRPADPRSALSCGFCRARKRAGARRALAPSAAEGGRVVADIRVSGGWGCLVRATEAHTACLPGVEAHRR